MRASAALFILSVTLLCSPAALRAEGTDRDVELMDRWEARNEAFKDHMGDPAFSRWWDATQKSLFGTRRMIPIVRDQKLLRNVLIQLVEQHGARFSPFQRRVLAAKIAVLDEAARIGSDPHDTGIAPGFVDRVPAYPGTQARWRATAGTAPRRAHPALRLAGFGVKMAARGVGLAWKKAGEKVRRQRAAGVVKAKASRGR